MATWIICETRLSRSILGSNRNGCTARDVGGPATAHQGDSTDSGLAGGPDVKKERTMRLRKQILCIVMVSLFGLTDLGAAQVDDAPSLAGVIDIHAHVAPETSMLNFKRAFDAIEAAQIARIYGMRGIVLKEHHTETGSWAY